MQHKAPDVAVDAQTLATLLYLQRRGRETRDVQELNFILVNETHGLTPYRQAVLWLDGQGVAALSGVVAAEANAPYVLFLQRLFDHLRTGEQGLRARTLTLGDLPAELAADAGDWLPADLLYSPIHSRGDDFTGGALLLARDEAWTEAEIVVLGEWLAACPLLYALLQPRAGLKSLVARLTTRPAGTALPRTGWRCWSRPGLLAVVLLVLLLPVPLTVLAPAELVPLKPTLVRAPLDGVVDKVLVTPNQHVRENEALFEFDRVTIRNRLQVAVQTLETTRTEYRQKAQQALFDADSRAQLAVLQGQIAEKSAEVDFLSELDGRATVSAPRAGVVLFDDPSEWVGRPVVTGERVMVVADEHQVEVEAWLSPADAIDLEDGAPLRIYLNSDPLDPLTATLRYVGHEAIQRPDGLYAYRVRAALVPDGRQPRVGLKGTAKLSGGRVSLAYWVFRRPLAAVRAWLGL